MQTRSEFHRHLRNIYLTLLILCIILLAVSTITPSVVIENAFKQIQQIGAVSHNLTKEWFDAQLKKNLPIIGWKSETNDYAVRDEKGKVLWYFHIHENLLKDNIWGYVSENSMIDPFSPKLEHPITLEQFRIQWDALLNAKPIRFSSFPKVSMVAWLPSDLFERPDLVYQVLVAEPQIISGAFPLVQVNENFDKDKEFEEYCILKAKITDVRLLNKKKVERLLISRSYKNAHSKQFVSNFAQFIDNASDKSLLLLFFYRAEGYSSFCTEHRERNFLLGNFFHGTILVPFELDKKKIDLLSLFAKKNDMNWNIKKFDSYFMDLARFSKDIESLRINQLQDYINRIRAERGELLQLFGFSFPQRLISTWGIVLIISIQLYFLVHLRHFLRISDLSNTKIDFPWIGIYPDPFARKFFQLSSTILPIIANFCLAIRCYFYIANDLIKILPVLGALVSSVLSFLTLREIKVKSKRSGGED